MKNLWKTADGNNNFAKFVWQHESAETSGDAAAKAVEKVYTDTQERLDYLRNEQHYSEEQIQKLEIESENLVKAAITKIEEHLSYGDMESAAQETVFKKGSPEANKIARAKIIEKINKREINLRMIKGNNALISTFLEFSMKPLRCKGGVRDYIGIAHKMVKYGDTKNIPGTYLNKFNTWKGRNELAKEMQEDGVKANFTKDGDLVFNGKTLNTVDFEVLMGGSMVEINKEYLSTFKLKNVIDLGDGKYMGFMENGCQGNLAIIDTNQSQVDPEDPEDPDVPTRRECVNGFINIYNAETGELIQRTSEKCGNENPDDPEPTNEKDCVNCETFAATLQANASKEKSEMTEEKTITEAMNNMFGESLNEEKALEKWNSLTDAADVAAAVAFYKQVEAKNELTMMNEFAKAVLEDGGFRDKMEKAQDGRFLEGGLIGWIEQIPKIFQNKDRAMSKRIRRKFNISREEYDSMMKSMEQTTVTCSNQIKDVKAGIENLNQSDVEKLAATPELSGYAEFQKAVEQGSLYQAKKMLSSDLMVTLVSMLIPPMGIPKDVVLTNVKLPKWLGSELHRLPGLNDIAKTSLGKKLGGAGYTEVATSALKNVDLSVQYGDNMTKLTGELMKELANAKTEAEKNALQAQIDKLNGYLNNFAESNKALTEGSKESFATHSYAARRAALSGKRASFGLFEKRTVEIGNEKVKVGPLVRRLKQLINNNSDGKNNEEISAKIDQVQTALVQEFNDDFEANLTWDKETGKVSEKFTAKIKKYEFEYTHNDQTKKEDYLITKVDGVEFDKLTKKDQEKAVNKVDKLLKRKKFVVRLANIRELSRGAIQTSSAMEDYNETLDQTVILHQDQASTETENNDKDVNSETAQENVISSSAWGVLKGMLRNEGFSEYLSAKDCIFSDKVKASLSEYLGDDRLSADEFKTLWKNGLKEDYNKLITSLGKALKNVDKNGEITYVDKDGNEHKCSVVELSEIAKEKEIYIYDDLTGETSKRLPITLNIVKAIKEVTEKVSTEGLENVFNHTFDKPNNQITTALDNFQDGNMSEEQLINVLTEHNYFTNTGGEYTVKVLNNNGFRQVLIYEKVFGTEEVTKHVINFSGIGESLVRGAAVSAATQTLSPNRNSEKPVYANPENQQNNSAEDLSEQTESLTENNKIKLLQEKLAELTEPLEIETVKRILYSHEHNKKILDLSNFWIPGDVLSYLPKSVLALSLQGSNVTGKQLSNIPKSLLFLDISNNKQLTDNDLLNLPNNLNELHLMGTPISDEGLKNLPPNIETLVVNHTKITSEGLANIPRSVKSLNISSCDITNDGLKNLPNTIEKLLITNTKIDDQGLLQLPEGIIDLDISNTAITGVGFANMPKSVRKITSSLSKITNEGLANVPDYVEELVIMNNNDITDEGLQNLTTNLKSLYLFNVSGVTENGVLQYKDRNPNIKEINNDYGFNCFG